MASDNTSDRKSAEQTVSRASAETVSLNTEKLDKAGKDFEDLNHRVRSLHEQLTSRLEAIGEPWGHDEIGKHFSEGKDGYLAAKDSVVKPKEGSLPILEQLTQTYGEDVTKAAKAYRQHEDSIAAEYMNAIGESGSGSGSGNTSGSTTSRTSARQSATE